MIAEEMAEQALQQRTAEEKALKQKLLGERRARIREEEERKQKEKDEEDEKAAIELLKTGMKAYDASIEISELAAWTSISRTILNMYETTARL